jgi:hypothetical protein
MFVLELYLEGGVLQAFLNNAVNFYGLFLGRTSLLLIL